MYEHVPGQARARHISLIVHMGLSKKKQFSFSDTRDLRWMKCGEKRETQGFDENEMRLWWPREY